jgi:hypothetical protein
VGFFAFHHLNDSQDLQLNKQIVNPVSGEGGITLLSEVKNIDQSKFPAESLAQTQISEETQIPEPPKVELKESCFELEGFVTIDAAKKALDALIEAGFVGKVVEDSISVVSGYWVTTKQFPSKNEALRTFREMQKQSIDSFIFDSGENVNAISVGLFKNRQHALSRQRLVIKKGFDVEITEKYLDQTKYKLDISFRGIKTAPAPLQILAGMENEINLTEKKCKEKAN